MRGSDLGLDDFDDGRVFHGAEVTKLITLTGNDLPHDTTHDLSGASLGQIADEVDLLGSSEGTNDFADLQSELLEETRFVVGVVLELRLEGNEGVDSLASKLIGGTNDSGLSNTRMLNQSRLDFSGTQTMTGDVDDVVNTTLNPDVAVLVPSSTVAGEVESWVRAHVCLEVTLVVAPDGTSDRRPRVSESQDTFNTVALELLAGRSVENDSFDAEEGDGGGTGFGWDGTWEGGDDD